MREKRIAQLRELIEQDPNDSFSRYALALEYAAIDNTAEALTLLEDLLQRDNSYVPTYQQLGYLYQKLGRRDDAAKIFNRGIQIAAQQGDSHARSEMQDALDELTG